MRTGKGDCHHLGSRDNERSSNPDTQQKRIYGIYHGTNCKVQAKIEVTQARACATPSTKPAKYGLLWLKEPDS